MRFAIDGLVLRESNTGENDKLLLILTASRGKIWVKAKGGRSIKNSKSALCRAFTYGEFELYDKNGTNFLSGGAPSNTFFAYKTDLVTLTDMKIYFVQQGKSAISYCKIID